MDLETLFGSEYPYTYGMEDSSLYSRNFVVLRFGEDMLSNLEVIQKFFTLHSLPKDNLHLVFSENMETDGLDLIQQVEYSADGYTGGSKYQFASVTLDDVCGFFKENWQEAQEHGPLVVGDNFVLGLGTSWVVFHSPDYTLVEGLRELAKVQYGFTNSAINEHGHTVLAHQQDDLPIFFLSKAPVSTIRYLPEINCPKNWQEFPEAGMNLLNYSIHHMQDSVRFHVDIDDAPGEIRSLFAEMGLSLSVEMVYHGVTAQNLTTNHLLSEETYREYGATQKLQSFVAPVSDVATYIEQRQTELLKDSSVFFGDGFAFGCYDRGVDFVFFDINLKAKFEDALLTLGYVSEKSWWEKPAEEE